MTRPAKLHGDWVPFRLGGYGGGEIFLPPGLAADLEAERRRRDSERAAAEEAEREAVRKKARSQLDRSPTTSDGPAELTLVGEHVPHPCETARHRVLVDSKKIISRVQALRAGASSDRDQAKREEAALVRALAGGDYRSVVRPAHWRSALDGLGVELPAFRPAISILSQALNLAEMMAVVPSVPPILLVGQPGMGKSYFCRRLIETLGSGSAWLAMDQPSAGSALRGSDSFWSNSAHGVLFELLALGATANPLIVIDEMDKASRRHTSQEIDPLSQLYSALEPETSSHLSDASLGVELNASQVMYVATANSLRNADHALLSRFEVVEILPATLDERREAASKLVSHTLSRMGIGSAVQVSSAAVVLLAEFTPRVIVRTIERMVSAALMNGRSRACIDDAEVALGLAKLSQMPTLH